MLKVCVVVFVVLFCGLLLIVPCSVVSRSNPLELQWSEIFALRECLKISLTIKLCFNGWYSSARHGNHLYPYL